MLMIASPSSKSYSKRAPEIVLNDWSSSSCFIYSFSVSESSRAENACFERSLTEKSASCLSSFAEIVCSRKISLATISSCFKLFKTWSFLSTYGLKWDLFIWANFGLMLNRCYLIGDLPNAELLLFFMPELFLSLFLALFI